MGLQAFLPLYMDFLSNVKTFENVSLWLPAPCVPVAVVGVWKHLSLGSQLPGGLPGAGSL